jgi:hypothetical protein
MDNGRGLERKAQISRNLLLLEGGFASRGFHLAYRDYGVPICSRVAVELMALGSHL